MNKLVRLDHSIFLNLNLVSGSCLGSVINFEAVSILYCVSNFKQSCHFNTTNTYKPTNTLYQTVTMR